MKLATLKQGGRDGTLVVVSRDLTLPARAGHCPHPAGGARRLGACEPQLRQVYDALNSGAFAAQPFDQAPAIQPLPRAYQWADGSAYVNHVELVRKARGAEMPESFWTDPLMYQGGSDSFVGPRDPVLACRRGLGHRLRGRGGRGHRRRADGRHAEQCAQAIRLVMLVNDVSLRNLIPGELAKGFGFFQSKPASAFSPGGVTPDELGAAWQDVQGCTCRCGRISTASSFGKPNAGVDMTFDFGQLIAHV
jgi:fumarylacetoacetate (FAA) hydrolase